MPSAEYRKHLYPSNAPRLSSIRGLDAYEYREAAKADPFTGGLIRGWKPLQLADFRGVSEDGTPRPEVHAWEPARPGEEAPVADMVAAVRDLLAALDADARAELCHPVDGVEWQTWANPEFLQFDTGIRLEFQPPEVRQKALALVEASLSPDGFRLVRDLMLINGFLGEVVGLQSILNEFSYNFALYGDPDPTAPWGWQLFGHHCAVHCLVVEGRMVVSPAFLGAEPNEIDDGPHAGTVALTDRIRLGTDLMAALPQDQRATATVYEHMVDPAMPPGRIHPGDERHLAGAFQDNRVIPVEGLRAAAMPERAREILLVIAELFVSLLPDGPRAARMREIRDHLDETWFSWIGGHEVGDVFYYRLQSPVLIAELDHHCGVFLDYDTPRPFHIHTVLRTPHSNDYGRAYVRAWQARNA
ncbi:DUF3500 domain-containing protein [Streptomyces sp. NPDC001714]|uniref:DUF3500 domain-containing protein n=1 Tax=Streptomyces sp. NPDC001714 TaxID=3364603 RepID=UPI0036A52B74